MGPFGKEASPSLSETVANSLGKAAKWSLVVLGTVSAVCVLMAVPQRRVAARAGWIQTPLSLPTDASDRLSTKEPEIKPKGSG